MLFFRQTPRPRSTSAPEPTKKKTYTSHPNHPDCVKQPSYEPGAPEVETTPEPVPPPKPAATTQTRAPSPPKKIVIPDVNPQEQSGRDFFRREILVHELQNEIKHRDAYLRGIQKTDSQKVRDHYRRLIRIHELNILAIQGELNLLGANSARN